MNQKDIPGTSQGGTTKNEGLVDQAKHVVENVAGQAREQVGTQMTVQKDKAAGTIGGVADALRQTRDGMKDEGPLPAIADQAADAVERVASYLQNKNVGDLVGEVERFARREPAIFLGSAFALGLLGGRFLKSSAPKRAMRSSADRFAGDGDYMRDEPARFEMPPGVSSSAPSTSTSGSGSMSSSTGTTTKPMGSVSVPGSRGNDGRS